VSRSCGSPQFARGFDGALHEIIIVFVKRKKRKSDRDQIRRLAPNVYALLLLEAARGDEVIIVHMELIVRRSTDRSVFAVHRDSEREREQTLFSKTLCSDYA